MPKCPGALNGSARLRTWTDTTQIFACHFTSQSALLPSFQRGISLFLYTRLYVDKRSAYGHSDSRRRTVRAALTNLLCCCLLQCATDNWWTGHIYGTTSPGAAPKFEPNSTIATIYSDRESNIRFGRDMGSHAGYRRQFTIHIFGRLLSFVDAILTCCSWF